MRNPVRSLAISSLISCAILIAPPCRSAEPDVQTIVEKSVQANQLDFKSAAEFIHREQDRTGSGSGSKTFEVLMIDGSPYRRLIAVNDRPLSGDAEQQEKKKLEQARSERKAESAARRQKRIAKYEKERHRNNAMMQELTKAFTFRLIGECKLDSFDAYKLEAKPRPGYNPPNLETEVLPAMEGELWIDKTSFQWVKVTAKVIRPASIEGFLAQVEPRTQFELEKMPVGGGVWLPKHFAMKSQAKVLFLVNQSSHEDDTFSDYHRLP